MSNDVLTQFDKHCIEWINQLSEGHNPFGHLAEEKVQEMYALAFSLYCEQKYQDAIHFFRMLVVCRPAEAKYWKSFGACLQMLQNYDEALNCYMSAQILKREQPDPYLYVHAADCYFGLDQKDAALKALEAARLIAEKKNDRRILKHVALMRELWCIPK